MGAGNPVIAHDNPFNHWVAGDDACYFNEADAFSKILDDLLPDQSRLNNIKAGILRRYHELFTWDKVLAEYETLLTQWLPVKRR